MAHQTQALLTVLLSHRKRNAQRSFLHCFTFITSGCLIRTRGKKKKKGIFNGAGVYMCIPYGKREGIQYLHRSMILSVASKRSVAAPTAKGRQLNQNSIHTYTAGKDQHLRLFTMYSKNIHP